MSRVAWVENDRSWIVPYIERLESVGHDIVVFTCASEAERAIFAGHFDLVLLDVMLPLCAEDDPEVYSPDRTRRGLDTGVLLCTRIVPHLRASRCGIMAITQRMDAEVVVLLTRAGLRDDEIATRLDLRDVDVFAERVLPLLAR